MSDDIDPEIAALIGGSVEEYHSAGPPAGGAPGGAKPVPGIAPPDFTSLFGDMGVTAEPREKKEYDVDLTPGGSYELLKDEFGIWQDSLGRFRKFINW